MKIQDLLTDESKWTTGSYARDAKGKSVMEESLVAVCWCLVGAIRKCYNDLGEELKIKKKIRARLKKTYIAEWSDSATFKEVRNLIEELDI